MKSKTKQGSLSLFALVTIGVGTAIGSGIVSVVGQAVAVTGHSAWLAILVTCLLGALIVAPPAFMCSMMRVEGGNYGFATAILGDYWGGVIGLSNISSVFSMSMFGTAFAMYIQVLLPNANQRFVGVAVMTVFFVLNLLGTNVMAKFQNVMTVMLIGGLLFFVLFGLAKLDTSTGVFDFSAPTFFLNGAGGFSSALMMMIFATTGMRFLVNFSQDALHPKRDITIATFITCGIVLVLYTGIAIVECGVLPIDQVAGKTLAVIAAEVMPKGLFFAFMIGGPIMALTTTINSSFMVTVEPIRRAAYDGFLPKKLAATNRFGSPWILMAITYLFAVTPLLLGISFQLLISTAMLGSSLMQAIIWYCYLQAPKKVPDAWENRHFKIPKGAYTCLCALSMAAWIFLFFVAVKDSNATMLIISGVMYAFLFIYPYIRIKMGKVKIEDTFDIII